VVQVVTFGSAPGGNDQAGGDLGPAGAPDLARLMYCDATSYLPGDLLCKVDRAAMAHGLEVRIPFLDHRVAAVAARIPLAMKTGGGGKRILREVLAGELPAHLFARPKAGFSVPIGAWLKGPLRGWANDMLARDRLDRQGSFCGAAIERRWRERGDRVELAGALSTLLRRTALARFELERVAALHGDAWLEFLSEGARGGAAARSAGAELLHTALAGERAAAGAPDAWIRFARGFIEARA
jgi:asparagine synthetase B (glutamine-hydrolysing)